MTEENNENKQLPVVSRHCEKRLLSIVHVIRSQLTSIRVSNYTQTNVLTSANRVQNIINVWMGRTHTSRNSQKSGHLACVGRRQFCTTDYAGDLRSLCCNKF
jgi:hypothetical protein